MSVHKLVYTGCSPHNGEYWYECSVCGQSDWIASYGKPDGLMADLLCKPKKAPPKMKTCPTCKGVGEVRTHKKAANESTNRKTRRGGL